MNLHTANPSPFGVQKRLEEATSELFRADVSALCGPADDSPRDELDRLLAAVDAALPALSNAITHTYFSHAQSERAI